MTEFLHQPQNEFALTFDLLGMTVLDPNKEFVVLEQPPTVEAQQTDELTLPSAGELTYIVIERDIIAAAPGSPLPPGQYRQWTTGKGAAAAIPKPLDESTHAVWRQSGQPMEQGGPGAHTWLLTTFFEKAKTPEDLAYVLNFGFGQTAHLTRHHRQMLGSALQAGIIKSLKFAEEESANIIPEAVGMAINTLEPNDAKWARTALQRLLVGALKADQLTVDARREARTTGDELMAQGIKMYEDVGLLEDSFWIQAGIKEVDDVLDMPDFLALVHARLTGPDGERIMGRIKDRRDAGRSYISAIFEHYAQDPMRHQANARRVLERTHSLQNADERKADLFSLIREANHVASVHNNQVATRRGTQAEKYAILGNGAFNYANAFLRVLSIMRDPRREPQIRAEQLEEDTMHADIVALLFTQQPRYDQSIQANLSVRFPDITPRRLRIAQEMAARGIAFRLAIKQALQEGKPQAESEPKNTQ